MVTNFKVRLKAANCFQMVHSVEVKQLLLVQGLVGNRGDQAVVRTFWH